MAQYSKYSSYLLKKWNCLESGYALIQPRVGIDLLISNKTWFTKIYAEMEEQTHIVMQFLTHTKIILKKEFLQEKVFMI